MPFTVLCAVSLSLSLTYFNSPKKAPSGLTGWHVKDLKLTTVSGSRSLEFRNATVLHWPSLSLFRRSPMIAIASYSSTPSGCARFELLTSWRYAATTPNPQGGWLLYCANGIHSVPKWVGFGGFQVLLFTSFRCKHTNNHTYTQRAMNSNYGKLHQWMDLAWVWTSRPGVFAEPVEEALEIEPGHASRLKPSHFARSILLCVRPEPAVDIYTIAGKRYERIRKYHAYTS